jgi:preprotein translocase subunit SecD
VLFVAWLALMLTGCQRKAPAHGNVYVLQVGPVQPAATGTATASLQEQSLAVQKQLQGRLAAWHIQAFFESGSEGSFSVKVPPLKPDLLPVIHQMLTSGGHLVFRMVHSDNDDLVAKELVEPGYELLKQTVMGPKGEKSVHSFIVNRTPERGLTGKYLKQIEVMKGQKPGESDLWFELNSEGAALFEQITREYQPKGNRYYQLAMVVDSRVVSAPRIAGVITGGHGAISGGFTLAQATALQALLQYPLPVPCRVLEERRF